MAKTEQNNRSNRHTSVEELTRRDILQKGFAALVLPSAAALSMTSCAPPREPEYESKGSYFDGEVAIDYYQTDQRGDNDYLAIRVYSPGTYEFAFELTPDKRGRPGRREDSLPEGFTKEVVEAPREFVVEKYMLPDYLRINITRNGETEFHDFQ